MGNLALERENSRTIGFVIACLFAEAITKNELNAWADHVLTLIDPVLPYIAELSTWDDSLASVYDVVGFVPDYERSEEEGDAFVGIAYLRGFTPYEQDPSKDIALEHLRRNPNILEEYRETFPFISIPSY